MEERDFKTDVRDGAVRRKIELVVLGIFTVFLCFMFATSQLLGWGILEKEAMVASAVVGWWIYARKYRDSEFRAKCYTAIVWLDFAIYVAHPHNFTSMMCTMSAIIVLLGTFYIPRIVYAGIFLSTAVLLYDFFIARSILVLSLYGLLRTLLHVITTYAFSAIMLIMIRIQRDAQERLLENIKWLEAAERGKDDFMANVSHEIRTPVNAVCGLSEAILQENLPVEVRRDVIDIQTAGRNLLFAVSNMLDFSELETGDVPLAEEPFNITSTVTDIINMALTLGNGKKLELIVDCDADLPSYLLGDEQKIRRVIVNLLDNAIKFTKEGGVVLEIRGRKEEYGINLLVSVRDSGIGIARGDIEKIFTSFTQVDSKRNRENGGVGLGLPIGQALVKSMGGFLSVESELGAGSEFSFTVPLKVLDETPIVSIKDKENIFAACYINMEKYNFSIVREGYEKCIRHVVDQLGILIRICKTLPELKRRMERENYTHIFISWEEYCEDRKFFDSLSGEVTIVLILDYDQGAMVRGNMLRIYKPFTVLSIAAVFNGQKATQDDVVSVASHQHFIAPEAHVLVVDDNVMNLKVMARLLMPYQIKVTTATSGREALDKLDEQEFDCVFLDHMMPEMDGVETLRRIRQKPGLYFQALKVIAFTANAIGGAREMFLSEGFDDFIAKPIEISVLDRMLRRYILPQKQIPVEGGMEGGVPAGREAADDAGKREDDKEAVERGAGSPSRDEEGLAFLELRKAGIDVETGIAFCGDKEGFQEILSIFREEAPDRRAKLTRMYEAEDWKNYVIAIHALKSNLKGIGAGDLGEMALQLEMAGKENRIPDILGHHEEFMERYARLTDVLDKNAFANPGMARSLQDSGENAPEGESGGAGTEGVGGAGTEGVGGAGTEGVGGAGIEGVGGAGTDGAGGAGTDGVGGVGNEGAGNAWTEGAGGAGPAARIAPWLAKLQEKLNCYESEGLEEILSGLAKEGEGIPGLGAMVEEIRGKADEFDFLGALDALGSWEERSGIGE